MHKETLEHTEQNVVSLSNPSPSSSGNPMKEERDGVGETENNRRTRPSNTNKQSSYELTETETPYTGPAQVCTSHLGVSYGFQLHVLIGLLSL